MYILLSSTKIDQSSIDKYVLGVDEYQMKSDMWQSKKDNVWHDSYSLAAKSLKQRTDKSISWSITH